MSTSVSTLGFDQSSSQNAGEALKGGNVVFLICELKNLGVPETSRSYSDSGCSCGEEIPTCLVVDSC